MLCSYSIFVRVKTQRYFIFVCVQYKNLNIKLISKSPMSGIIWQSKLSNFKFSKMKTKKLQLRKEKVSNLTSLSNQEMANVNGGTHPTTLLLLTILLIGDSSK